MLTTRTNRWRIFAALLMLSACSEGIDAPDPAAADEDLDVRHGWIIGPDGPMELDYVVRADGSKIYQGDMVLGEVFDQSPGHARAGIIRNLQWAGAVVPYEIDPGMPNQVRITDAIAEWNNYTPYYWRPRQSNETAYVRFIASASVCESAIGRQGNRQDIKLAGNCDTSSAIHEMGHAVGLFHEQSRKDRDSYITIAWSNVKAAKKFNFDKYGSNADDWGVYDVSSIMHYPSFISDTSFVNNPNIATITRRDGTTYSSSTVMTGYDRAAAWWRADVGTPVKTRWSQLRNYLGWPVDREWGAAGGGTYLQCQNGRLYNRADVGTFEVNGRILDKYDQYGAEWSFIGYPLTDESPTADGVGRYNHFQAGSIFWHPNTGAFLVYGLIRQKWAGIGLGWERSFLGYPTTDELGTADGVGRYNHFQGGSIFYHPSYGTFAVGLRIRDGWAAWGWERSCLGYPVADEVVDQLSTNEPTVSPVRTHQMFSGGRIDWNRWSGAVPQCF